MTQANVLDFLKDNSNSWFSTKQIAKCLKQTIGSTTMNLNKLRTPPYFVLFKRGPLKHSNNRYVYRYRKTGETFIVENI